MSLIQVVDVDSLSSNITSSDISDTLISSGADERMSSSTVITTTAHIPTSCMMTSVTSNFSEKLESSVQSASSFRSHRKRKIDDKVINVPPPLEKNLAVLIDDVATKLSDVYAQYVAQRMKDIPPPFRFEAEEAILRILNHFYRLSHSSTMNITTSPPTSSTWGMPALPEGIPGSSHLTTNCDVLECHKQKNSKKSHQSQNLRSSSTATPSISPSAATPSIPLLLKPIDNKHTAGGTFLTPPPLFHHPKSKNVTPCSQFVSSPSKYILEDEESSDDFDCIEETEIELSGDEN